MSVSPKSEYCQGHMVGHTYNHQSYSRWVSLMFVEPVVSGQWLTIKFFCLHITFEGCYMCWMCPRTFFKANLVIPNLFRNSPSQEAKQEWTYTLLVRYSYVRGRRSELFKQLIKPLSHRIRRGKGHLLNYLKISRKHFTVRPVTTSKYTIIWFTHKWKEHNLHAR